VREHDGCGHQLGCFVAGIPKDQTLIARTHDTIRTVHALTDVLGLPIEAGLNFAAIRVDSGFAIAVPGILKHLAHQSDSGFSNCLKILDAARLEFAGNDDALIRKHRFACDTRVRIKRQKGVENAVGNPVSKLVRVTL
jgi:hypothetical protein